MDTRREPRSSQDQQHRVFDSQNLFLPAVFRRRIQAAILPWNYVRARHSTRRLVLSRLPVYPIPHLWASPGIERPISSPKKTCIGGQPSAPQEGLSIGLVSTHSPSRVPRWIWKNRGTKMFDTHQHKEPGASYSASFRSKGSLSN